MHPNIHTHMLLSSAFMRPRVLVHDTPLRCDTGDPRVFFSHTRTRTREHRTHMGKGMGTPIVITGTPIVMYHCLITPAIVF